MKQIVNFISKLHAKHVFGGLALVLTIGLFYLSSIMARVQDEIDTRLFFMNAFTSKHNLIVALYDMNGFKINSKVLRNNYSDYYFLSFGKQIPPESFKNINSFQDYFTRIGKTKIEIAELPAILLLNLYQQRAELQNINNMVFGALVLFQLLVLLGI